MRSEMAGVVRVTARDDRLTHHLSETGLLQEKTGNQLK